MLRHRVADYQVGDLERQFPKLDAEEGYLFAYGFMTLETWHDLHCQPRIKLSPLERDVLAAVTAMKEAHPRALDEQFGKRTVRNCWGGKSQATKRILEDLHHHGFLRVSRREKGVRVYQAAPKKPSGDVKDPKHQYERLALTKAQVFGPTSKRFLISELGSLKHLIPKRSERVKAVDRLVESGQLSELEVESVSYLWKRDEWQVDELVERARILAPVDPLVRDRQRFEQVWDWRYRFEAYAPAARRERGYYAMPVLWQDKVIGWANAKVNGEQLDVTIGYIGKRPRTKAYRLAIETEVEAMTTFLGLNSSAWELKR